MITKKGKIMYEIKEYENGISIYGKNQIFTQEDIQKLRKEGIIYHKGGLFAIKLEERINNNPLCIVGLEDDGCIHFHKNKYGWEIKFDAYWLQDLMSLTEDTIKHLKFERKM